MLWIVLIVVIALVVIVSVLKGRSGGGSGTVGFPYQPAKVLFSAAERSFLSALDQAVGNEFRVFGKVRVADVASVKSGLSNSARQGALNRIAAKHFDFVVCRKSDLSVVCAVELNDKSHASKKAQARDELLSNVCRVINLPLITVVAKAAYAAQDIRAQVIAAVGSDVLESRVGTLPGVQADGLEVSSDSDVL